MIKLIFSLFILLSSSQLLGGLLEGKKIALDPGHFGGAYASLEERQVAIEIDGKCYRFCEGDLSLFTAKILKHLLVKEGATVFLTREKIGQGAIDVSFEDWLIQNHPDATSPGSLFRNEYNVLDLRKRAEKINQFGPDIAIMIHFNDSRVGPDVDLSKASHTNYNMFFIPGAFLEKELKDPKMQDEYDRLLKTNDFEKSLKLSKAILEAHIPLGVEPVKDSDNVPYLKSVCIKVSEGIYARNLALTRLVHCPLCYGETLCQDDEDECKRLNETDFSFSGMKGPFRAYQVALCYFRGILSYFLNE